MKRKVTLMLDEAIARDLRIASAVSGETQSAIVERGVQRELREMNPQTQVLQEEKRIAG